MKYFLMVLATFACVKSQAQEISIKDTSRVLIINGERMGLQDTSGFIMILLSRGNEVGQLHCLSSGTTLFVGPRGPFGESFALESSEKCNQAGFAIKAALATQKAVAIEYKDLKVTKIRYANSKDLAVD